MTDTTATRPRRRARRKLLGLPALFLLAVVVGSASLAGLAGATSSPGGAKFNAATWKPTLETPLPPMEGPLTFHLSDQPGYWYDNGRSDLEGILHTRSLSAAVAGVPTKIKFEVAEPLTSENHTVSSIVPNGDGDLSDSRMTGGVITSGSATKINDDTPTANFGQGGQGVWAYPDVYNGWVQELPDAWKSQLTCAQLDPLKKAVC